ncbi:MAG: DNA-processing protein DprA [Bacillota bacterium]|nr:DNA-processing protein DprA [Bacillota bacterium]
MNERQTTYILAIHSLNRVSAAKMQQLLDHFDGSAEQAWRNIRLWDKAAGYNERQMQELLELARYCQPERIYQQFLDCGCGLVMLGDSLYPPLLTEINDAPYLLFYRGNLPKAEDMCLALIGARQYSGYGRQVAEILARDLAIQEFCIVSGMARGIDGFCHQAAIEAGGQTVAVLGSGLDVIYPREHAALYQRICENGAVISEFPLGMAALAQNFPRRNRIISGLSRGVVVIEATQKSGTLLTVYSALAQQRDVFAVPGPITSRSSAGTNQLIRDGSLVATCAEDIWREYLDQPRHKYPPKGKAKAAETSAADDKLLDKLTLPLHFDELLAADSSLDAPTLAARLTVLEIRGLIKQLPGRYYQRTMREIKK